MDFLSDLSEVIKRGSGSQFKRDRLLKKVAKFGAECRKVGADIHRGPNAQRRFVETLCKDGFGNFRELMFQFCASRLIRGDYTDWTGWEYRNEWATSSYAPEVSERRWRLEEVGSLAVLGEQGIGDEIMFGSCLQDLKIPKVVVELDPRVCPVFKRAGFNTKPRIDIVKRGEPVKYLTMDREEEKFIPLGDLPRFFRKKKEDFHRKAYLKPLDEYVEKWKHLKGKTGLAWRSRTGQFKPGDFGIENPVCLQYDAWEFETEGMIVPDCDLHNDIEDLFGICANLEKVVSVGQTIVHIAGSIGTKVEVVMPPLGSSRVENQIPYRYSDPMLWYPDVKVFQSLREWKSAL